MEDEEDEDDEEEGEGPDEPEPEVEDSNQESEADTAKSNSPLQFPLPILGCCHQLPVLVHPDLCLLLCRPCLLLAFYYKMSTS